MALATADIDRTVGDGESRIDTCDIVEILMECDLVRQVSINIFNRNWVLSIINVSERESISRAIKGNSKGSLILKLEISNGLLSIEPDFRNLIESLFNNIISHSILDCSQLYDQLTELLLTSIEEYLSNRGKRGNRSPIKEAYLLLVPSTRDLSIYRKPRIRKAGYQINARLYLLLYTE